MTVVDRFVQAVSHGGLMKKPTLIVIHDAETPLAVGYAKSIAENWFGKSATTSAHFMVDPGEIIRMLSDNVISYAVGPNANGFTINIEQAGRASFSRADWTTKPGMAQHDRVGALVDELAKAHDIPKRWATDEQIRAAAKGVPGGICFHDDIRRVLGGTTHTDPVPNYPTDLIEKAWTSPGVTPAPTEENDMTGDQATQLAEIHWMLTQIKPATDRLEDEDAQTDQLMWAITDPEQGLRAQVARLAVTAAGDPNAVAVALAPLLVGPIVTTLSAITSLTKGDVETAIRSVLGSLKPSA